MNVTRTLSATLVFASCLACLSGCVAVPRGGDASMDETGAVSVEFGDSHYETAVAEMASEMLTRGFPMDYVVVLGAVDTRGCKDAVKVPKLHKSLRAVYNRHNILTFLTAEEATSGKGPAAALYKTIESNWMEGTPVDRRTYQEFGDLANANAILLCRVSLMAGEARPAGGGRQVTYRFLWKLANTQTGGYDVSREENVSVTVLQPHRN